MENHITKKLRKYLQRFEIETFLEFTDTYVIYKRKKVKLTLYILIQSLRFPVDWGSQISRQSAREYGHAFIS
jgi:hypothetical protein